MEASFPTALMLGSEARLKLQVRTAMAAALGTVFEWHPVPWLVIGTVITLLFYRERVELDTT